MFEMALKNLETSTVFMWYSIIRGKGRFCSTVGHSLESSLHSIMRCGAVCSVSSGQVQSGTLVTGRPSDSTEERPMWTLCISLILRRSRTGTVWFYTSTSNKRAARPKLYTKSLTRDLKFLYSRLTLVRISIKL